MQAEIVCSYAVASTQEEDRVTMDSNGTLGKGMNFNHEPQEVAS